MNKNCITGPAKSPTMTTTTKPELLRLVKIWDDGQHNAFTDLKYFRETWYCTFRSGGGHVSCDSSIQVLSSADGERWESIARLTSPHPDLADLRDPKLCVTPDDRLMLTAAAVRHDEVPLTHQTYAWFSEDGASWAEPVAVGEPNFWMWRVTWHEGQAYGAAYHAPVHQREPELRLYRSRDGAAFEVLSPSLLREDRPNESTLLFEGDAGLCLVRHEGGEAHCLLGSAKAPYQDWQWKDLGRHLGGPNMIRLPDGRLLAAGRLTKAESHTVLCLLDTERGALEELLTLPSSGDNSYPGLVWQDGLLWVSYYSAHEGQQAIYVAKVRF